MIELATPQEIIVNLSSLIENERRMQNLQQKELALKADVPLPSYRDFIYKKRISLESLIKILIALRLFDNISGLLKQREYKTLDEIKKEDLLLKRIVK
ncbi:helix-turn-helix domain-containing protein [Sulfurimonas sp.]|uniref:helix-turn-helix domain-containing protein n=1 Tax=Sulfurimonas sp. TaxID=2022749 RepID=UPI0025D1E695|nr:helix-turn-helix domain-containing protein [Sulfurimonas sp.]MDD5157809.1 helix-turn-helix domain-containing protein [Sulfurimonas sp.]